MTLEFILVLVWAFLTGIDWKQTISVTKSDRHWEMNPLLGKHPTEKRVNIYFVVVVLILASLMLSLNSPYNHLLIGWCLGSEFITCFWNWRQGL